jgi:acetyltransferase-like isoleucine patch superfamily enzyme
MLREGNVTRLIKDVIANLLGLQKYMSSERYIKYARENGCTIGDGTQFFGEKSVDIGAGSQIEIGEDCVITNRVRLLAHTWDVPILRRYFGQDNAPQSSARGKIVIGDNVFIGENSIVLPDTSIGDNTIIGAGSVVSNDIPSESVAVGNPCRVIMDLEQYNNKRLN